MMLRIHVEDDTYDVEVEFLDDGAAKNAKPKDPEQVIPANVLRKRPPQKMAEDAFCRCPIAGRVTAIFGAIGQCVKRDERVMMIEAMKMETAVAPAVDGVIRAIHVSPGEAVKTGQILFELD